MLDDEDINLIDQKQSICDVLDNFNCIYEIFTDDSKNEEYKYLNECDICITVYKENSDDKLYIDLENGGELTFTFGEWHYHYELLKSKYNEFIEDLTNVLTNKICTVIIYSKDEWIASYLSTSKLDKDSDCSKYIQMVPKEFKKKLVHGKGKIELIYWNDYDNATIEM